MPIGTSRQESVIVCCCSLLYFAVIMSVSATGLWFILSLNSVCKGIKLYLHEVPDIDVAVYSQTYTDILK
jgi:hypothetical protein